MNPHDSASQWSSAIPASPVRRWTRPLRRFLRLEAASGIVLRACTILALILANSIYAEHLHHFWHTRIGLTAGSFALTLTLEEWINDGLMTLFFFVIGLEIKRELVFGELRDVRKASPRILAIKEIEDEADDVARAARASLFKDDRIDPVIVIRWKGIYEALEDAVDTCETAAHNVGNILVKNA